MFPWFPFIFVFVYAFLIFLAINVSQRKTLRRLIPYLPGVIRRLSFLPTYTGEYMGLKFAITLVSGSRNSPPMITITLYKGTQLTLNITRENPLSRFAERLGLMREVKVNDPVFDDQFLIFSNHPDQARGYLVNSGIKNTVRQLFDAGFNRLSVDGKRIYTQKPCSSLNRDFIPEQVVNALQKISLLIMEL